MKRAIIDSLLNLFDREVDAYWIAQGFFHHSDKFIEGHSKFKDLLKIKLELEDLPLYKHLTEMNAIDNLPLDKWFGQCFAGYILETSLVRIWDKLLGGSCQIIVFLAAALLIHFRQYLMKSQTNEEVNQCLANITKEAAEIIVSEAIDLWQEYGGPTGLTITEPIKPK